MDSFEDVEYLDETATEISIISIPEETIEESYFAAFDASTINNKIEAQLTTFMELDDSIEEDEPTLQTSYSCPVCKVSFIGKEAIKKHVRRYFKHVCEACEKSYFRARYLKRHLKNAHLESKQLVCPICTKELRAVNNLKQHLLLHSHERKFECPIESCKKRFKQKPGLQQHIRIHHKHEMKKECPYCHALVVRLYHHLKVFHKEEAKRKIAEIEMEAENEDNSSFATNSTTFRPESQD